MVNSLKCQACLKHYTIFQNNRIVSGYQELPLLLVCGHTFCQKCLTQIYIKEEGICCPLCDDFTACSLDKKKGINGLYPHICALGYSALSGVNLLDKVTTLMNYANSNKVLQQSLSLQQCSECMQRCATVNCIQCGVNICDQCFQTIHQNSRVLQRHQAISVKLSAHNISSLDCSKHHSLTNFYCVDDNALICHECINQDHHNHEVISLRQKTEQVGPEVKESLKKVNVIMSKLEKYICDVEDEINAVFNEVKKTESDILTCFLEITGKMQSKFLMLMDNLEKLSYVELEQLLKLRDAANRQFSDLHLLSQDAQLIVNSMEETDSYVVDPVKTLASLKRAEQCHCVLEKVSLFDDDGNNDCESPKDADRFLFIANENIFEVINDWGTITNIKKFEYISKPFDDFDSETSSNVDLSQEVCSIRVNKDVNKNKHKMVVVQVPPAQNQELVFVSLVSNPDDFFIQRHNDRSQLSEIEKKLKMMSLHQTSENCLSCVYLDDLCAVCLSHKEWYRAKVTKVIQPFDVCNQSDVNPIVAREKNEVELFLIDCGKSVKSKVSCLRALPHTVQYIPPLAIPCSLVGVRPTGNCGSWSEKAVQMFARMISNRPVLMTTIKREQGRRFVDLHKPASDEIHGDVPVSVRDALVFLRLAKFNGDSDTTDLNLNSPGHIKHRNYFRPTVMSSRTCVNVVLSHYHSISRFYVQQLGSNAAYFVSLNDKIQNFIGQKLKKNTFDPASPYSVLKPFVNMPCLAKYACCNMWFRAKVLEVMKEECQVKVLYVDYGNDALLDAKDLLKIPNEFMKLPYQGLECRLADITPPDGSKEWSKESMDRFFQLVGDNEIKMMIRSYDNDVYSVELFDLTDNCRTAANDLSVNERLVHEGLASGLTVHKVFSRMEVTGAGDHKVEDDCMKKEVDQDSPLSLTPSDNHHVQAPNTVVVTVIHCLSPALFYIQNASQWRVCNDLTRKLNTFLQDQTKHEGAWSQGDKCALHSVHEKRWCRGVLCEVKEESMCVVHLIDFGLTEVTSLASLADLPEQFKEEEAQTTACFIADIQPAGGKKWSNTALDSFKEMVHKKKCSLHPIIEGSTPLPVKLFVDEDVEVGRELILRGVALPVFRLDLPDVDGSSPHPLSKIQQEFEKSQAAYFEAENVRMPELAKPPPQPLAVNGAPCGVPNVFRSPLYPVENLNWADCVEKAENLMTPEIQTPVEVERPRIPHPDVFSSQPPFDCIVSHIEKFNLLYIKRIPIKFALPDDKLFGAGLSQLECFDRGTPCLVKFLEDGKLYRAEVLRRNKKIVSVLYVDYGLTQEISDLNRILALPNQFAAVPRKAAACLVPSMPSIVEASLPEAEYLSVLADLIGRKRFSCSLLEGCEDEPPSVNLHYNGQGNRVALSDMFVEALALLDYERF